MLEFGKFLYFYNVIMWINAKEEFSSVVKNKSITCAYLYNEDRDGITKEFILKKWYTEDEYNTFLKLLDFRYDNWYGWQNLFWNIWLEDWTRFDRWEYDWSEWWSFQKCPEINEKCLPDN